jgi:hypothetical protein
MDRFEGRCRLRWHLNPVTAAAVDVEAVITAEPGGWTARGRLVRPGDDEGFRMFLELDPLFTLAFEDGGAVEVLVRDLDDDGRFVMVEGV